jgi:hypothetical protein
MVNVSEKMNTTTQQSESDNQTKSNKKSSNKRSPKSRSIHKSNKNKRNTEKSEASMKVLIQKDLHFINHTLKFDILFLFFV